MGALTFDFQQEVSFSTVPSAMLVGFASGSVSLGGVTLSANFPKTLPAGLYLHHVKWDTARQDGLTGQTTQAMSSYLTKRPKLQAAAGQGHDRQTLCCRSCWVTALEVEQLHVHLC